jgi:acyl-CoA hydrolase
MAEKYSKYFLVRPQDLNHAGTLFGGVMMSLADEMAFVAATLTYRGCTFVTKVFKEFDFISGPVEGEIVKVEAEVLRRGNSSVTVAVHAVNAANGREIFQTEAVLVNARQGKSVPIPISE